MTSIINNITKISRVICQSNIYMWQLVTLKLKIIYIYLDLDVIVHTL